MKELGEGAEDLHREVGASARASGIDRLFALGELARHSAAVTPPGVFFCIHDVRLQWWNPCT